MLNNVQPINVTINDSNQLKKKLNVMFKYKPKGMQDYFDIP
jgi:hypothetical protein